MGIYNDTNNCTIDGTNNSTINGSKNCTVKKNVAIADDFDGCNGLCADVQCEVQAH